MRLILARFLYLTLLPHILQPIAEDSCYNRYSFEFRDALEAQVMRQKMLAFFVLHAQAIKLRNTLCQPRKPFHMATQGVPYGRRKERNVRDYRWITQPSQKH